MNCPDCKTPVGETTGSPISPYINTYRCRNCSWTGLRCGDVRCDGYLVPEEMGSANDVRYNCATCGWTGTGRRLFAGELLVRT
jgi:hypothetical protein